MTSDPDDGSIESPSNRADHANPRHPEPLAELLRAAASPVLSRALAGEDAAVAAFREARINQRRPQRRLPTSRRLLVTLCATFAASLVALLATVLAFAATTTSTPAREPSLRPGSGPRASTGPSPRAVSTPAAHSSSDSRPR